MEVANLPLSVGNKKTVEAVKFSRPVGYVFDPTDYQLVGLYLYNKMANQLIPGIDYFIPEYNLYDSEEPWQIWNFFKQRLGEERDEDLFFFTQLKKKTSKGSRIDRTVGTGTWQGEDGGTEIVQGNRRIGTKKRFRYENKDSDQHGGWIMHEYSLDSSLLGPDQRNDYVVCRIRKNEPALKKNKRRKFEEVGSEKKNKRTKVQEVDSEKKNRRTKVQEVDSEPLPLAVLSATISSSNSTNTSASASTSTYTSASTSTCASTIVQQPLELDNNAEFYNDEEYSSIIRQCVYHQYNDSPQFSTMNDIFGS